MRASPNPTPPAQQRDHPRRTTRRPIPDFTVCPFGRCGPLDPERAAEPSPAYRPRPQPGRGIIEIKATR